MLSHEHQIELVVAALRPQFPLFAEATIERRVRAAFDRYQDAPVENYLPILVQREVEQQFREASLVGDGGSVGVA